MRSVSFPARGWRSTYQTKLSTVVYLSRQKYKNKIYTLLIIFVRNSCILRHSSGMETRFVHRPLCWSGHHFSEAQWEQSTASHLWSVERRESRVVWETVLVWNALNWPAARGERHRWESIQYITYPITHCLYPCENNLREILIECIVLITSL